MSLGAKEGPVDWSIGLVSESDYQDGGSVYRLDVGSLILLAECERVTQQDKYHRIYRAEFACPSPQLHVKF
jgi:hypothetical protein